MENLAADMMLKAIQAGDSVRCITSPNPWVGCVVLSADGQMFTGATYEDGQSHAEVVALNKASASAAGSTMFVTLEPCCHKGKTLPCVEAIVDAGVKKVYVGVVDPDSKVNSLGIKYLTDHDVEVEVGLCEYEIEDQLAPYLHQRRTGKPFIVLKTALTLDGNIADSKGKSKWITGKEARINAHMLRAQSDVVVVGANTVRQDDPSLTVRDWKPNINPNNKSLNPRRIVIGNVEQSAKVHPCEIFSGEVRELVDQLSSDEVLQVLIEGGSNIYEQFHRYGIVDRYIFYLSPSMLSGVGTNIFSNTSGVEFEHLWRGEFQSVVRLGSDIRLDVVKKND